MISHLLVQARNKLQAKGYQADEADLLLAAALKVDRSFLYSHDTETITAETLQLFDSYLERRLNHEPIAYILGHKAFYGREFGLSTNVLIPRPESEQIIDEAKNFLHDKNQANILDMGTGSGCLIITLALETNQKFTYQAADISLDALAVAQDNADTYHTTITWHQSDLWQSIPPQQFDLILANLPYLTAEQLEEQSIKHEPVLALYGGRDGLDYYRRLLRQMSAFLAPQGVAILEINPDQEHLITQEFRDDYQLEIKKDLTGRSRIVCLKQ